MEIKTTAQILNEAKSAKASLGAASVKQLDDALTYMADSLVANAEDILAANQKDVDKAVSDGRISPVMIDRLRLTKERIDSMAKGILEVVELPSPLGKVLYEADRPNGLKIQRRSVPFGVVAIIYESRPNVTSDAAALAIKSGNVCVLRSGKEAFASAYAIVKALREGIIKAGLSPYAVNLIEDTTRQSANELMRAEGYVDLLIPRGGAGLIRACVENATVPCIHTGTGICHIYVDKAADIEMALNIVENAKTSRPSVCNAAEVCVVHSDIIGEFLPRLHDRIASDRAAKGLSPVEFRCDERAYAILGDKVSLATDEDFDTEFLDYILAVKTVDGVEEAIAHIDAHSTHHSEAIITGDESAAAAFVSGIDSAAVYVNASTRFTDGGEFGFGCEMGISTQKNHPRGPMGLPELTTYKYVITGNGQIR